MVPSPEADTLDSQLEAWRTVGDPDADSAVMAILRSEDPSRIHRMLADLEENDDPTPPNLPEELAEFLERTVALPEWADLDRIAAGQRLFGRHGPAMSAALLCASLPECYAAAKGVQVLALTERMRRGAQRRIYETAQFLVDVMQPGSFAPDGQAARHTQKVRLMHAAVRQLASRHERWDASWGVPINQEDLLGTQLAFGVVVLDALPRMGIDLETEEIDGYLHTWAVLGFLLGLNEELIPHTLARGRELRRTIQARHHRPTPQGVDLTRALIETLANLVPGTLFDGVIPALMHHLCAPAVPGMLEIPRGGLPVAWGTGARLTTAVVDDLGDESAALASVARRFSNALLQGLLWINREGKQAEFRIPTELASSWGLPSRTPGRS